MKKRDFDSSLFLLDFCIFDSVHIRAPVITSDLGESGNASADYAKHGLR